MTLYFNFLNFREVVCVKRREKTVNSEDLSGTPCPFPPPLLPRPPALSIFTPNQLFIPLHHHTMGSMHRIYKLSGVHTRTQNVPGFMPVVDYIRKKHKAVSSFIKNTRQQLLKYSHPAETTGRRFSHRDFLKRKDRVSF